MERYKLSKNRGALQEAMVQQFEAPSLPSQSYAASHGTMTNMPALRLSSVAPNIAPAATNLYQTGMVMPTPPAAARDTGLDPHRTMLSYSMFFCTIPEGQRVLVKSKDGSAEVIQGPKRVWSWGRRFEAMAHYVAHPGEFLIVRYRDGRQEHLIGPVHCWLDTREHLSVEKEEAVQISAKEAVVVYAEGPQGVTRRIEHGPATFVPKPGEWLHTFSWHGSVAGDQHYRKVPNALVFQKLWLMPDQMYHDVTEVRTADDALLTVRLMLFFELVDIDLMLANSHDPIGDFVNAATSDVVEVLSRLDFEAFKEQTHRLNDLATYKQLVGRAQQCGYRINKVVYRGYGAPPALQQMHDQAIESRTRLQLEKATQQQAQELEDFKQERLLARASKQRQEDSLTFEHRLQQEARQREAALEAEQAQRAAHREQARLDAEQQALLAAAADARQREHLSNLRELGVDLTALLTQHRADKVIEVRGNSSTPHLHLDR